MSELNNEPLFEQMGQLIPQPPKSDIVPCSFCRTPIREWSRCPSCGAQDSVSRREHTKFEGIYRSAIGKANNNAALTLSLLIVSVLLLILALFFYLTQI